MFAVLIALSPGLIGSLFSAALARRFLPQRAGIISISLGAGGVLGYIALGVLIDCLDRLGHQSLTPQLITCLLLVLFSTVAFWGSRIELSQIHRLAHRLLLATKIGSDAVILFLVVVLFASLFFTVLYSAVLNPVSGWDSLGLWTEWARIFLDFDAHGLAYRDALRAEGDAFPIRHPRHPMTIIYISAFSGYALQDSLAAGWLVPWSYVWICGAIIIFGSGALISGNKIIGLIGAYLFCSTPLLTNHAILLGYADHWILVGMTAAVAMLMTSILAQSKSALCWGAALAMTPMLMKNTGVLYATAILLPLSSVLVSKRNRAQVIWFALLAMMVISSAVYFGFNLTVAGSQFALIPGRSIEVIFAGYTMEVGGYSLVDVLRNHFWAFFVNLSFSTIPILGLFCVCSMVMCRGHFDAKELKAARYLILVAISLIGVLMLPQLAPVYSAAYAEPESDKGMTRFLMPIAPTVIMMAMLQFQKRGSVLPSFGKRSQPRD